MWQFFIVPRVKNFGPSLIIIMDNGDQYYEFFMFKDLHNVTCQILING